MTDVTRILENPCGSDDHCTEFCVITCWKCCMKKNIRNNKTGIQKKMNCELMLYYDTPALRQTGSRNLTGQKTLPTILGTYMKLVTKYQISAINSYWEKCDEKYLGRTEGRKDERTDRRTEVKQYTPPPSGSRGIKRIKFQKKPWDLDFFTVRPAFNNLDYCTVTSSF